MNKEHQLPHEISQRLRLLDVLDRITQVSLACENMEQALSGVLDLVLDVFDADRAWFVYPCDPDTPFWGAPMERTRPEWPGLGVLGKEVPMTSDVSEIFSELLGTNGTIQYGPHADHPVPAISAGQFSVKSQLQIALRPKIGKPWLLGMHHCAGEVVHNEEDLHLFTAIAQRISETLSVFISTQQLSESEAKFRTLFDSTSDAVMLLDETGFIDCNRAALEIFGCASLEEFCLKHPADFSPPEQPDGTNSMTLSNRQIATAKKHGSHFFEWMHKRADTGRNFPAEVLLSAMELEGKTVIQATVRDITKRRQAEDQLRVSEERLRLVLEATSDGLWDWNLRSETAFLSPRYYEMTGYRPDEVTPDIEFFKSTVHPDDLAAVLDSLEAHLQGKTPSGEIEYRMVTRSGEIMWTMTRGRVVERDAAGAPLRMAGTITDINRIKLAERKMHNLAAHLQTVREEEKISISREIHDDLGGTLSALKMETHWLKSELSANPETTPLGEHVEAMSQLIDNATATMRNILTGLRPTILDDLGLLAALEWQAEQFQKRTGIKCLINCIGDKGNLEDQCSIALFRISQEALTNILRHSGASRVEIEYHHSDDEIVMSIIDNGLGMTNNDTDTSTSYGIHGMRERVDRLGGKINFDTPPGGGFNVTVILPLPANEYEET